MRSRSSIKWHMIVIKERLENPDIGPREKITGEVMLRTLRWVLDYKRIAPEKSPKQIMLEANTEDWKQGDII